MISNNQSNILAKNKQREEIEKLTRQYLESGGNIDKRCINRSRDITGFSLKISENEKNQE